MTQPLRVLLLAGTTEARDLASRLDGLSGIALTVSLAGSTRSPIPYAGHTRVGGFGGADGLLDYVRREGIELIINATHPYATQMTANAEAASQSATCRYVRLLRPAWSAEAGDDWHDVPGAEAAAGVLPSRAHVLCATGRGGLEAARTLASGRPDVTVFLRTADPITYGIEDRLPPNLQVIVSRPPHTHGAELALMQANAITDLILKNSGGTAGRAKMTAARQLGISVWMIARPPMSGFGATVETVTEAQDHVMALRVRSVSSFRPRGQSMRDAQT